MNSDHFGDNKKWSYRVTVKGENVIDRQKKFNLLVPHSRDYVNDFLAQNFLSELNMISLRVKAVKLVLNGRDMGTYLKEEFYDKRLVEFNKYRESPIIRLNDDWSIEISQNNYLKYKTIVDNYQKKIDLFMSNKIKIDELFNFEKMSDRLAQSVIFGDSHSLYSLNQRYYINPFTLKLEPLGREYIYSEYENLDAIKNNINIVQDKNIVNSNLFNEIDFLNKFRNSLDFIASEMFLNRVYENHFNKIDQMKKIFHREYPFFDSNFDLIFNNSKKIRENISLLDNYIIKDLKKQESKIHNLKILDFNLKVQNDSIIIDKSIIVSDKLYIPSGYNVLIKPGVEILLTEKGQILSESSFYAVGTEKDSIKFISNTNNKGILFLNANESIF